MTQRVGNPFAPFLDRNGLPLTGTLYVGVENADPETSPVTVYFDKALTQVAPQPITVVGGLPRNAGNPASFYVAEQKFSLRTRDEDGGEVFYVDSDSGSGADYQPLDSDLTAIAALGTTAYGRGILALANAAAGRAYLNAASLGANTDITSVAQSTAISASGTIGEESVGFRGLPNNTRLASYTLVLADAGRLINTTSDVNIPANASVAFPVGTAFSVYNANTSPINITIASDFLYRAANTSAGPRVLAGFGLATFVKINNTSWVGSGAGLS